MNVALGWPGRAISERLKYVFSVKNLKIDAVAIRKRRSTASATDITVRFCQCEHLRRVDVRLAWVFLTGTVSLHLVLITDRATDITYLAAANFSGHELAAPVGDHGMVITGIMLGMSHHRRRSDWQSIDRLYLSAGALAPTQPPAITRRKQQCGRAEQTQRRPSWHLRATGSTLAPSRRALRRVARAPNVVDRERAPG